MYNWQCFKPWAPSKLNFSNTETLPTHPSNLDHIELLRLRNCHFDCILYEEGGLSLGHTNSGSCGQTHHNLISLVYSVDIPMTCWQWQILRFPKKLPFGVLHYPVIQEIFVVTQEIFSTHSVFSCQLNIVDCEFLNTKILYTAIFNMKIFELC